MSEFNEQFAEYKIADINITYEHLGRVSETGIIITRDGEREVWFSGNTKLFMHEDERYNHIRHKTSEEDVEFFQVAKDMFLALGQLDFNIEWAKHPDLDTYAWYTEVAAEGLLNQVVEILYRESEE